MSNYHEKFLEAEEKASQLVTQLEELKKTSQKYSSASTLLTETREDLGNLIGNISDVVKEEKKLISTLKEIGTSEIIREIDAANNKIETLEQNLSEFEKNQTKFLSQLKLILFGALGLIIISIVLNIIV